MHGYICISLIVCADLSGKEPPKQVSLCRMVTSENLGGVMVSILAHNARELGSVPDLDAIFPIPSHPIYY